jgi:hypothetical protein
VPSISAAMNLILCCDIMNAQYKLKNISFSLGGLQINRVYVHKALASNKMEKVGKFNIKRFNATFKHKQII